MKFELATHDDQKILQFDDLNKTTKSILVRMYSRGFSINRTLYFDDYYLDSFKTNLKIMQNTSEGKARLGHQFEDEYIELTINKMGHVLVKAEFFEHSEHSQSIKLEFKTDSTCLESLIKEVNNWDII